MNKPEESPLVDTESTDIDSIDDSEPPSGKLGVLVPGLGAVGSTFISGTIAARRGLAPAIGSLAETGEISLDSGDLPIREAVDLAELDDLVFGGWDIRDETVYEAAKRSGVLEDADLEPLREELSEIHAMPGVFDADYVRNLSGEYVKDCDTKMEAAEALMDDIEAFITENDCSRAVAVWCGSTERHVELRDVHMSLDAFEEGLRSNHEAISPTMIYAYAHLKSGVPFLNGAPNRGLDVPAIVELADKQGVPFAGKDFKTGQTFLKTAIAPALSARRIGVKGWYSTNILGNMDGHVLDDPGSFKTKEESKLSVLDSIFKPETHEDLYGDYQHKVRIDYYPPRGDNKEGWDNIDIFGWMGYSMQIKINFLCRDSILAAPLVLDLALFGDLASRAGMAGNQSWLSFYFKHPQVSEGDIPVHDLFEQRDILFEKLRALHESTSVESTLTDKAASMAE